MKLIEAKTGIAIVSDIIINIQRNLDHVVDSKNDTETEYRSNSFGPSIYREYQIPEKSTCEYKDSDQNSSMMIFFKFQIAFVNIKNRINKKHTCIAA